MYWLFGDNMVVEGMEVIKIYLFSGEYEVWFKIFIEGGMVESF